MKKNFTKEWCVIFNPKANEEGALLVWQNIQSVLYKNGFEYELLETKHKRHAIQLVQDAITEGQRYFIAVGGSGLLNEIVTGIMTQNDYPPSKIFLTTIPTGSYNDWAKHHGIPTDFTKWIPQIQTARADYQDVISFSYYRGSEQHYGYSLSFLGLGFSASIVKEMYENSFNLTNKVTTLMTSIKHGLLYLRQPLRITYHEKRVENLLSFLYLNNCKYGGGYNLTHKARHGDGEVVLTHDSERMSYFKFLYFLIYCLIRGKFIEDNNYTKRAFIETCKIESTGAKPADIQADGEYFGHTPCEVKVLPQAIGIIVP